MTKGHDGVPENHSGSGVAHDLPDAFTVVFLVAMYGTVAAGGFRLLKRAAQETFLSIVEQLTALPAEVGVVKFVMIPAVNSDHRPDCPELVYKLFV